MGVDKLMAMKLGVNNDDFKEGNKYIANREPVDVFEKELKLIRKFIDKNFVINVVLLTSDMTNPFEKAYLPIEAVYGADGECKFKATTYEKRVDGEKVISFILNERSFWVNSYDEVIALHTLIVNLVRGYERHNSSMGIKPINCDHIVNMIREYGLKLEKDKDFIIATKEKIVQEQINSSMRYFRGMDIRSKRTSTTNNSVNSSAVVANEPTLLRRPIENNSSNDSSKVEVKNYSRSITLPTANNDTNNTSAPITNTDVDRDETYQRRMSSRVFKQF